MNTFTLAIHEAFGQSSGGVKGLLLQFLVAVLIIGGIGALIWCIEKWIKPIPDPGKLIIVVILVICLIVWAINVFL